MGAREGTRFWNEFRAAWGLWNPLDRRAWRIGLLRLALLGGGTAP